MIRKMGCSFFYSFKFGLVIIAATLLGSCMSAPRKREQHPDTSTAWWFSPCDTDLTDLTKLRHGRSASDVVTVKLQLKIFVSQLKQSMKKIDRLYATIKGPTKGPNARIKWLKIKKMLSEIKQAKLQPQMIKKFQEHLQYFAGTLDVLRRVRIETEVISFNQTERRNIYQNIGYHLRNLLCELERTRKTDDEVPKIPLKNMKIPLRHTMDYTNGHIVDVNFFKKTISFFKKSQFIMFKKNKVKSKNGAVKKPKRT